LENTIRVAQVELLREVDYQLEANAAEKYQALLNETGEKDFVVPDVFRPLSTQRLLTTRYCPGVPLGQLDSAPQSVRNMVIVEIEYQYMLIARLERVCFAYRFMSYFDGVSCKPIRIGQTFYTTRTKIRFVPTFMCIPSKFI
jgi:hypothetical protein